MVTVLKNGAWGCGQDKRQKCTWEPLLPACLPAWEMGLGSGEEWDDVREMFGGCLPSSVTLFAMSVSSLLGRNVVAVFLLRNLTHRFPMVSMHRWVPLASSICAASRGEWKGAALQG